MLGAMTRCQLQGAAGEPYQLARALRGIPARVHLGRTSHSMFFHSEHRQIPRLRAMHPDPEVLVHPNDAEKYGIRDGEWVWIENQRGKARQKARVTVDHHGRRRQCRPRLVVPRGGRQLTESLWRLEGKRQSADPVRLWESGFGSAYKSMLCKVYPDRRTVSNCG